MITAGRRCDVGVPLSGQTGFLTSVRQAAATSTSASLRRCRWNVTVDVGRTINVTLYDFGVSARQRAVDDQRRLLGYQTIVSQIVFQSKANHSRIGYTDTLLL